MKLLFITLLSIFSLCIYAQEKASTKKKAFISGKVVDEKKKPVIAKIDLIDNEFKNSIQESESSSTGNFRLSVSPKNNYIIYAGNPDYLFQSVIVSIPDSSGYEKKLENIVLQKVEVGKKIVLHSLSFDFYQAIVLDESRPDLERIIALMNDMPNLQIEISGFTDKIGSVSFNRELSEKRAKALVDVLISSGFDNTRMKYKGYGPDQPIASNFTEEGRQMNNRIELKILKLDLEIKKDDKTKQKKGVLPVAIKQEDDPINEDENEDEIEAEVDTVLVDKSLEADLVRPPDTLARVDYKGKFIADKSPLAFSTVNLLSEKGIIFKSTLTDQYGAFEFLNVDADQEISFGLDQEETKDFKTIVLADTAGTVIKELDKINGEFVLALLPSEKTKLGTIYLVDTKLKPLKLKSKKVFLSGRVIDEKGFPVKVQIEIIDNNTNKQIGKYMSNNEGRYSISLLSGKNYDITFNKSSYLFQSVSLLISGKEPEKKMEDIVLQKVEVGKKIVLNNIFFDSNESTLRNESFSELERAVMLMKDMVSLEIEISGHTDNVGSGKSNRQLSEQRAKAVADFLISKGCDKNRIKYKGYGSGQPIANNNTEAGRQLNRRTEFKVLKVDLAAEQLVKAKNLNENNTNDDEQNEDEDETNEEQKSKKQQVPSHLKSYDKDLNGIISYEEIVSAIDAFFEEAPKVKEGGNQSIFTLLDFYFDQ